MIDAPDGDPGSSGGSIAALAWPAKPFVPAPICGVKWFEKVFQIATATSKSCI